MDSSPPRTGVLVSQTVVLLDAVNAYLCAQNGAGYSDGDYGRDSGCREVRRSLCKVAYRLNSIRNEA